MKRKNSFELRSLIPFIWMFKDQWKSICIGLILAMVTIAASIGLLGLSGWFLSATAIAGFTALGIKNFNFYTPAAGVRFLAVLRTAGRYGERVVTHDATLKLLSQIRIWLWQRLQPLSFQQLLSLKRGDILSRLLTDINTLDQLYLRLLTPFISFILLVLGGGLALSIWMPLFAGYLVACMLLLGLLLPWFGFVLSKSSAIDELVAKNDYRNSLLEYCSYQIEFKLYSRLHSCQEQLLEIESKIYKAQAQLVRNQAVIQGSLFILHGALVVTALYVTASASLNGEIASPIVAMVVLAIMAVMELLMPVALSSQYLSACSLAASRINELTESAATTQFGDHDIAAKTGSLVIENLSIGYDQQDVLQHFDLNVEHGKSVAIIGHSGCGKTSLLSGICRLIEFRKGDIKLDGINIVEYSERALRQSITLIEQQPQIFSATLKDNLMIALADGEEVDDSILEKVLLKVELAYLLEQQGLNLWVGDGGRQLSGGELRRLSFARALLRDAQLILLDEPTEGLDIVTEQKMMNLMLDIFSENTLIIVTHRVEHLHKLDRVISIN